MLKTMALLLCLLPTGMQIQVFLHNDCSCPVVTNLLGFAQDDTYSLGWNGDTVADGYILKYLRVADGYVSTEVSTSSQSYVFTDLDTGSYKFYVAATCNGTRTAFIVTEDIVDGR